MVIADPPEVSAPKPTADEARSALAAEWASRAPRTADEVTAFYRECPGDLLAADLDNFHDFPERQRWTEALIHVAREQHAALVVDIGCGAGHDLAALAAALPADVMLYGVEPNAALRADIGRRHPIVDDVQYAPIEAADLLSCFDVLEHVPDPEAFLYGIATRAKVGAMFMETTATTDCGTPLHLEANRGWQPGRAFRRAGWECIDESGRMRVWQRFQADPIARTPIVVCANREVSVRTFDSVLRLMDTRTPEFDWRPGRAAESGLLRARSVWASKWYREYADDGFLMVDADIEFDPQDAEKVVRLGREKRSIAVAAYSVRDGGHLAIRGLDGDIAFGPNEPPAEIRFGATGFMYVHRDVLGAMIPTLPLCHASQPWALWPMFDFKVIPSEQNGDYEWLSEDWWFCERARQLGFKVWLDPSVTLTHWGHVPVTVRNMQAVRAINAGLSISVVRE
jgi:SAM-dependent methyltransferase